MTVKNYAIYSIETGYIDNVACINEDDLPNLIGFPAEGFGLVELPVTGGEWSTCGIGWSYIDGQFVEPPAPPEPEQPVSQGVQAF
jgi:hypothetical protein